MEESVGIIRAIHMLKTKTKSPARTAQAKQVKRSALSEGLRNDWVIAALLFCLALAIRVWGLSFGLPFFFSTDEINKRDAALRLAETGFIHRNSQPSFLYNSLYLIFSLARLVSPEWTTVQYHYMGRVWMAVLGALTVVVVYRLGSVWDRRIGLLAALFLAILPLHTTTSRYIKEDTPLALMTTIAILLMVFYLRHPSRPALGAAALFAGISFSTKYSGLPVALPLILAGAVSAWRTRREVRAIALDLTLVVLAFWAGFFLVSPIYLFHLDLFVSGFLGQWDYSRTAHHDGIVYNPWQDLWLYYIRTGLIPGMTWPLFLLSVAGLILMPRSRDGWVITVTAAWLYLVFEHGRAKPYPFSARYLLPLAPLLCVSAADALVKCVTFLKRRLPVAGAYALCVALFVLPPLVKTGLIADEALHDTRTISGTWMEQAIPSGSNLVVAEGISYLPVSEYWGREWRAFTFDRMPELYPLWQAGAPVYFVLTAYTYDRYLSRPEAVPQATRLYRRIMSEYRLVKEFRPRWLSYGLHSPVIRVYQPPTPTDTLSFDPRGITGREA